MDEIFLQRCLLLAQKADSRTYPNPKVGAVIVHQGRIIGEGFHAYSGGPHAEVVAVQQVEDLSLLKDSTLYVSLEPCCHHGKTPPCTSLILEMKIPRVVVGCVDSNPQVGGKGIALLRAQGVEVVMAENPQPFLELNRIFFHNQEKKRPYICLKWAESKEGFIAALDGEGKAQSTAISGKHCQKITHALRAKHQAILVGKNTALIDNPSLNLRYAPGLAPLKIVLDKNGEILSHDLQLFQGRELLLITENQGISRENCKQIQVKNIRDLVTCLDILYQELGICSILVEGGREILNSFLEQNLADEIWVYKSSLSLSEGVKAPDFPLEKLDLINKVEDDLIYWGRISS